MITTPHTRDGRAFHAVNLEALMGEPARDPAAIHAAWRAYSALIKPGDAVVVGAHPSFVAVAGFILPRSVRWVVSSSGADRALVLDAFAPDHASRRFEWLVLGGAGGELSVAAVEARLRDMRVCVVSGASCAAGLSSFAHVTARIETATGMTTGLALAA